MTMETLTLRDTKLVLDDGIATLSHERPTARNALSMDMRQDYREALDRIEADRSIRALVITGSGGSFCAGGDLKSLKQRLADPAEQAPDSMRRRIAGGHAWLFKRLQSLEIPVIAAVDGPAYGAGFSLALTADFVLASSRAAFCMSFAKVGLVPDMGAFYLLPRAVGLPMAKELAFTARRVGVDEAKALGIVHSIHTPEALLDAATAFARRFTDAPREAIALSKQLFNRSYESDYDTMAAMEGQAQAIAAAAPYHGEAVAAFLAGQPAKFDWDRG